MKFDPYAVLAGLREAGEDRAIRAIRAIPTLPNRTNRTDRIPVPGSSQNAAATKTPITSTDMSAGSPPDDDPYRYGVAVNGNPKTWTGRVVSFDEWRRLSDWDRHGSTGMRWDGRTRQWVPAGGLE
jgi:hypothetical protein